MPKKCKWIAYLLLLSQIIFSFTACGSTSDIVFMDLRYISLQGNTVQQDTWNTKSYLCEYFHLQTDEFMLSPVYSGTRHDSEKIPEIIDVLKTATYIPCDIEPDDYECLELLFIKNIKTIKARVIYAYRYSNGCVYAFYQDKCYRLQNYNTLKTYLGRLSCTSQFRHLTDDCVDFFFYDRFFYDQSYDDVYEDSLIYDNFINTSRNQITTKEDIEQLAIKEISERIEIIWPPEFEFFPEYKEIQAKHIYYDKFSGIWLVEIFLYYPIDTKEETINGSPGKNAGLIYVYLNDDGCTQLIWDPFEMLSSKLVPWLK